MSFRYPHDARRIFDQDPVIPRPLQYERSHWNWKNEFNEGKKRQQKRLKPHVTRTLRSSFPSTLEGRLRKYVFHFLKWSRRRHKRAANIWPLTSYLSMNRKHRPWKRGAADESENDKANNGYQRQLVERYRQFHSLPLRELHRLRRPTISAEWKCHVSGTRA